MALTDTAETQTLAWLTGQPATAPVLPLQVALVTTLGSDATPGTEVSGGGYTRQDLTLAAGASTALLRWTVPVGTTVAGVEIWDSATTPVRWWHSALGAPATADDGVVEIPAGDLTISLD